MGILPRIRIPRLRFRRQKLRRWIKTIPITSFLIAAETLVYALLLILIFTGKRAAFLNQIGEHADVFLSLLLIAGFALFDRFARRKIVPRIEQHFFPKRYDERKVFSGLGQEVRSASTIDQLYFAIINRIAESFEASSVALLVRDSSLGDFVCTASSSQMDRPKIRLARESFILKRLNSLSTPLVIEPGEIDSWNRALASAPPALRQARTREHESLLLLKSHLLVQIRTKEQMVGVLSLSLRRGQFRYGPADRETLTALSEQLALVIENSRLAQRMVVQERLNRELALAGEVQRRLLPHYVPDCVSAELSGFCEPARGVGGDYYDFITLDKDRVGIAIADVAGKGMPAALLMSTVQATVRSLTASANGSVISTPSDVSLAQMVSRLNRLIFNSTNGHHYVTFFYAHFDQSNRLLTYVNAGHNPPLCLQSNGTKRIRRLTAGGLIAGAFEDCKYDQETFQMHANDLLLLYTDGLSEAMSPEGEEFGESRIEELLSSLADLSAQEIRDRIAQRIKEWCRGAALYDDLTFVVMKVN